LFQLRPLRRSDLYIGTRELQHWPRRKAGPRCTTRATARVYECVFTTPTDFANRR